MIASRFVGRRRRDAKRWIERKTGGRSDGGQRQRFRARPTGARSPGKAGGPLSGLSFAAKDLFDVAGVPTGGGNHDLARFNPVPDRHGFAVQTLLDAGADLVGKTITDEVSLGILGENAVRRHADQSGRARPRAGRLLLRFGGGGRGGALRHRAGHRHRRLGARAGELLRALRHPADPWPRRASTGMLPQAPSSDTTGWFARDAETFARVSTVHARRGARRPADAAADRHRRLRLRRSGGGARRCSRWSSGCRRSIGAAREEIMAPQGLSVWARAQRTLQPVEAWADLPPWIETANPRLAFSVAAGLLAGAQMPAGERNWAAMMRLEARARLRHLLPPGTILCLPTTPFPAPLRGLPLPVLQPLRDRITCLCAQGGLTGSPQVNLPGATVDGAPVGLSIIGGRGDGCQPRSPSPWPWRAAA